ncbi:hypothetical protein llap_11017 [Limosa lapponica baueri]|uniref:Uncharacterized protein n=1 Tax=Limosa lapponica baueri TaxID=1758121 RepID=A0A2I0TY35_LIMLA|nr:hypothetical protein llap_11017 [Limosa lapponica baueri]
MEFNKVEVLHLEQNDPVKLSRLNNRSAERESVCSGEHKIEYGSAVCFFEMMKPKHILGYINKSLASRENFRVTMMAMKIKRLEKGRVNAEKKEKN